MKTRHERIMEIRGRERYQEGIQHLRVVSQGAREGALETFRAQAERLLSFEQQLDDQRRLRIRTLLATGGVRSTEDALLLLEHEESQP